MRRAIIDILSRLGDHFILRTIVHGCTLWGVDLSTFRQTLMSF